MFIRTKGKYVILCYRILFQALEKSVLLSFENFFLIEVYQIRVLKSEKKFKHTDKLLITDIL